MSDPKKNTSSELPYTFRQISDAWNIDFHAEMEGRKAYHRIMTKLKEQTDEHCITEAMKLIFSDKTQEDPSHD